MTRLVARTWLVEMNYLDPDRARVSLMTADGLDADIVGLCEPLEAVPFAGQAGKGQAFLMALRRFWGLFRST